MANAPMIVSAGLYRNATLLGGIGDVPLLWPSENSIELRAPAQPQLYYDLRIAPLAPDEDEIPYHGWTSARALLMINGAAIGDMKPVSWYTAEPTDWPSGIVRWVTRSMVTGFDCSYSVLIRRPR